MALAKLLLILAGGASAGRVSPPAVPRSNVQSVALRGTALKAAGLRAANSFVATPHVLVATPRLLPLRGALEGTGVAPRLEAALNLLAREPADGLLGPDALVPVKARRLATPDLLWVNHDYFRERGVDLPGGPAAGRVRDLLLEAFAWGLPKTGEGDDSFLPETMSLHATRYGGFGLNGNRGDGRAARVGGMDFKGLGPTPLVLARTADHSNGVMSLEEALREAAWSEISHDAPHGAVRVLAILDRGTSTLYPDGRTRRDVIVVREARPRAAHLQSPHVLSLSPSERPAELERITRTRGRLKPEHLPAPRPEFDRNAPRGSAEDWLARATEWWTRAAEQYAFLRARRVFHGSPTASNIGLGTELLDHGTQTAYPGYGRVRVMPNHEPAGETSAINEQTGSMISALNSHGLVSLTYKAVWAAFEKAYRHALRAEFLALTGLDVRAARAAAARPQFATLADDFIAAATEGALDVIGRYDVPDRLQTYDVNTLLIELARQAAISLDVAPLRVLIDAALHGVSEERRERMAVSYAELMKGPWSLEDAVGRNRPMPELYRWNMIRENEALIDAHGGRLPPEVVQGRVDELIAAWRAGAGR